MAEKKRSAICGDCSVTFSNGNPRKCKDGVIRCKKCRNKKQRLNFIEKHGTTPGKKYGPKYRDKTRDRALMTNYGISQEDYLRILEQQGGGCAICKALPESESRNFPIDHDHSTGKVRGILCTRCNMILGQFKDNIANMRSAASYLLRNDAKRSWDHYFLDIAELVAVRSKDPSSQVGAIIVRDRNILSTGYNGFPRGVNDNILERYERPTKYQWTIHAEENAIFNASRNGISTEGATLYVIPMHPCIDCAKAIAQSGIKEVVYREGFINPRWINNFEESSQLFKAAKILVRGPE
jgi:dCMP deaminase